MTISGFRADSGGGTNQNWYMPSPNRYIRYSPSTVEFDVGSVFATGGGSPPFAFTPPTGTAVVHLDAQIWVTFGAKDPPANFVIKWIKNFSVDANGFLTAGTDVVTGIGNVSDAGAGTCIMRATGWDEPSEGDYYGLFVWVDAPDGSTLIEIDSNKAHSFMSAAAFG